MPPRRRPRLRGLSVNALIPNALTVLGLCMGLTSIRFALLDIRCSATLQSQNVHSKLGQPLLLRPDIQLDGSQLIAEGHCGTVLT